MEYEINFLVLQSHTEEVEQIRDKVKSLIKEQEGSVTDELIYKKRKLAYEIKHELYGFFTVLRFNLKNNSDILELKRELNLVQDVSRYMIVRADELPELNKEVLSMEKREESTVKQEDVEKIIAKSEVRKAEVKREEQKEEKKVVKEVEEEKEEVKVEEKVEEKKEEKKEEVKEEKKEAKEENSSKDKKSEKKEDDDDKSSLEDLDKKLDEILSI